MRIRQLLILFIICNFTTGISLYAATMQEALDKAAEYFVRQAVKIESNEELHILHITDYYTREKSPEGEKIETELYFALEKLNPDFKLFLGEVENQDREIYLDGTYEKKSGTVYLKLRVYKGTEILAQIEVEYDSKEFQKTLVAVLDIESNLLNEDQRKLISDIFRGILSEKNKFEMVSTADIDKMDPDAIQESTACSRDECAIIIGEQLGIDRVISTSLRKMDENLLYLTGKVMDVENGTLITTRFVEHHGSASNLRPSLEELAELLVEEPETEPESMPVTRALPENEREEESEMSFSVMYHYYESDLFTSSNNPIAIIWFGREIGRFSVGLELMGSTRNMTYEYEFSVPYGVRSDSRSYSLYMADILAKVHFDFASISPYAGLFVGMMSITEKNISAAYFNTTRRTATAFPVGLVGGIRFFSKSDFNIQLEGRYITVSTDEYRQKIDQVLFGQVLSTNEAYDISGLSLGLGVTFRF